jgi:hypothetical protein
MNPISVTDQASVPTPERSQVKKFRAVEDDLRQLGYIKTAYVVGENVCQKIDAYFVLYDKVTKRLFSHPLDFFDHQENDYFSYPPRYDSPSVVRLKRNSIPFNAMSDDKQLADIIEVKSSENQKLLLIYQGNERWHIKMSE